MSTHKEERRKRRNLIQETVEKEKTLTLLGLQKRLAAAKCAVSLPTLRADIEALTNEGAPLELSRGTVAHKPWAKTEFERRSEEQKEEKAQIAEVAWALLLGEEPVRQKVHDLVGDKIGWQGFRVRHVLEGVWQKSHRILSLDAGSSTRAIAQKLSAQTFPAADSCSQVSVVTNAPLIVEELYKSASVQTVLIGGELRRERYSIVGHLAERCLDAFDIVTDISFIGATGVDLNRGFTSDNAMEAQMKSRLLDASRVRCVILDHTKVIRPGGTFSVFVGLSPRQVDFVLMNNNVMQSKEEECRIFRDRLEELGIGLLTPEKLGLVAAKKGAA